MVTYKMMRETLNCAEIGSYTAYGIAAYKLADGEATLIKFISDVFLNENDAESFVKKCNELKLDIIHLCDVIEDFIA